MVAKDGGKFPSPLEGRCVLQIEIIDVNEHRPVIHLSKYNLVGQVHTAHPNVTRVYVTEAQVAKQRVYTVVASDGDHNNILRYSLSGLRK